MVPRQLLCVMTSPKFLVASVCNRPDVINCQFRLFNAALLGPVHFLSPDQQSGIYCLIIRAIQLLTANNLGRTWRYICSPDIRNVSALEVLCNYALQIARCRFFDCACLCFQFVLSPVHTTRVHGPRSWAMFLTPVNMGHEHSACPHCPCSWAVNMGSVYWDLGLFLCFCVFSFDWHEFDCRYSCSWLAEKAHLQNDVICLLGC